MRQQVGGPEKEVTKVSHVTGKWSGKQPAFQLHFHSPLGPLVSSIKIFLHRQPEFGSFKHFFP